MWQLTPEQKKSLEENGLKLLRLKNDYYIQDTRKEGDDYCVVCGCIAPKEKFLQNNSCPNPKCARPDFWDDKCYFKRRP